MLASWETAVILPSGSPIGTTKPRLRPDSAALWPINVTLDASRDDSILRSTKWAAINLEALHDGIAEDVTQLLYRSAALMKAVVLRAFYRQERNS